MILCLCRGVPDHAVESAISGGAGTVGEIERSCGAGGDCGACRGLIEALVERAHQQNYAGAATARGRTA